MFIQILGLLAMLGLLLYGRDHRLKKKFRGCRQCGNLEVKRFFKMYPIRKRPIPPIETHVSAYTADDGRLPFAVYKFTRCPRCEYLYMSASEDKRFTPSSLRAKASADPGVFVHDRVLFKSAGLEPCDFLDLKFEPSVLGMPSRWERAGISLG